MHNLSLALAVLTVTPAQHQHARYNQPRLDIHSPPYCTCLTLSNAFFGLRNHLGVLLVAREWLAIGIRRQSCDLISRAFGLASKAQIPLGTLVDAQGDGRVCGGSLAAMAPLLFSPKSTHPCNVGKPVLATEYAPAHCAAVHRTHATLNDGWVFGRFSDLGVIRNFASPAFERDFATIECMDETFRANNQHVLRRVLPPQGCVAMSHAVGSQVRGHLFPTIQQSAVCQSLSSSHSRGTRFDHSLTRCGLGLLEQFRLIEKASDNPPPASFRTTVRTQDGKTIDVDALFAMRVAEPATTRILCTLTPVGPTMDPGAVTSGTASITPAASTTVPNIDIDIPELDLGSPPGLPQYPPTIDSKDTWNFDLSAELGFDTAFLLGLGLEEWGDPKDS